MPHSPSAALELKWNLYTDDALACYKVAAGKVCEIERLSLSAATVYWVSEPMMELVSAATPSMPLEPLRETDVPSPQGLVVYPLMIAFPRARRPAVSEKASGAWPVKASGMSVRGRTGMKQGKLVRDRVPQIIRARGDEPLVRVADRDEYRDLLRGKLTEEVEEFLSSEDPEELADILEVVLTLAGELGVDAAGLETLRTAKVAERGGFAERIVWHGNGAGTTAVP